MIWSLPLPGLFVLVKEFAAIRTKVWWYC